MKQAILLLIHKNLEATIRLIAYFKGNCDIFVHIDKDFRLSKKEFDRLKTQKGVVEVVQRYKVNWGGFSILQAERLLLQLALKKSDFNYVHLLSGQDYPIKPLDTFLEFFATADKEYLQHTHLPHPNWDNNTMQRLQYFFFMDHLPVKQDADVKKLWHLGHSLAQYGIKRSIPDHFMHLYGGSQWFSISREAAKAILAHTQKHPSFYRRMRFVYCPDEIYFTTVLMNIDYPKKQEIIGHNLRFIKWPFANAQHPKEIGPTDLRLLAASNAFFARKMGDKSNELKDLIDHYFLKPDAFELTPTGILHTRSLSSWTFDEGLARHLLYLCHVFRLNTAIDLGCGAGLYVDFLNQHHITTSGYDGNRYTPELYRTITQSQQRDCQLLELHHPIENIEASDIVLLLSVGEYIPQKFQQVVLDNACLLAKKCLVISWTNVFGTDIYVQNPIKQCELECLIREREFELDLLATHTLRNAVHQSQHKNAYVFTRKKTASC